MMLKLTSSKNTLAYQLSRPSNICRDMSQISMKRVSDSFMHFRKEYDDYKYCSMEALWFYGYNHLYGLCKQRYALDEPIRDARHLQVVQDYNDGMAEKTARMFYYVLAICIRESRHLHNKSSLEGKIKSKFGDGAFKFLCSIEDSASKAMNMLANKPPNIPLGACVSSMTWAFYNGSWSTAYGGPAWGEVCECLERFVKGETTGEMFMDTAFTLAHNNGPIFNKSMLYHNDASFLLRILDVQNSGQIPEMIIEDAQSNIDSALVHSMKELAPALMGTKDYYVDWHMVEAMGSKGSYPNEKQQQLEKHGTAEEKKAVVEKAIKAQELKNKEQFEYTAGKTVPIVERSELPL